MVAYHRSRLTRAALKVVALAAVATAVAGPAPADDEPAKKDKPAEVQLTPGQEVRLEVPAFDSFVRVYVPADYRDQRRWPVIFCYHGYRGKATTWPFRQVTRGKGFVVVGMSYATKEYHDHPNYSRTGPEQRFFAEVTALLAKRLRIDPKAAFMGGFSQGGYSTTVLGEVLLDRLAGLVILGAGRSHGDHRPPPAKAIRGKPIFIGAGTKDEAHCPRARLAAEIYAGWGAKVTHEEWDGLGHTANARSEKLLRWLVANGPLRNVKARLAAAQNSEKLGQLGRAYAGYRELSGLSETDESCLAAARAAKAIADQAEKHLAAARDAVEKKQYPRAVDLLAKAAGTYEGCSLGRRARDSLAKLESDPKVSAILRQARIDTQADALEAKARAAEQAKDYANAIRLYEQYVAKWAKADRFGQVKARLEAMKSDKKIIAAVRQQQAETECRRWMTLARNYKNAGLDAKARQCLDKIVKKHGGTSWAEQARRMLADIEPGE